MRKFLILGFAALTIIAGSYMVSAQISGGGGNLGGDVIGTLSRTVVRALQGRPISSIAPSNNQALCWNGAAWAPGNCGSGGGGGGTACNGNALLISTGDRLLINTGSVLCIR